MTQVVSIMIDMIRRGINPGPFAKYLQECGIDV